MITKKEAIAIAEAIANAGMRESRISDIETVPTIRGTVFAALENVWYEVLPMKTREQFFSDVKTPHENYLDVARKIIG